MSTHYKQPLDWNDKLLDDCYNTLNKWYSVYLSNITSVKISDEIPPKVIVAGYSSKRC